MTSRTASCRTPPSDVKSFWYSIRMTAVRLGSIVMEGSSDRVETPGEHYRLPSEIRHHNREAALIPAAFRPSDRCAVATLTEVVTDHIATPHSVDHLAR